MFSFSPFVLKRIFLLLVALFALAGAPTPAWADSSRPAKAGKGKKKVKKGAKKSRKPAAAAENSELAALLIPEEKIECPFDRMYNRAMQMVYLGKCGPDDILIGGDNESCPNTMIGLPLLAYAARMGNLEAMKFLVEKGAEYKNVRAGGAIMYGGNVECLKYWQLLGEPLWIPGAPRAAKTAMMFATQSGNVKCLDYVYKQLQHLIAPNFANFAGKEELFCYALESGNPEMVKYYEKIGLPAPGGSKVILFAAMGGNVELLREMMSRYPRVALSHGEDSTKYAVAAAASGNLECLRAVVETGAPVSGFTAEHQYNYRDAKISTEPIHYSPLLFAARAGSMECVRYLESKGAVLSDKHLSLCECAVMGGNIRLLEYFLQKKPGKEVINKSLGLAARMAQLDMVRLLVEKYGADIHQSVTIHTLDRLWVIDTFAWCKLVSHGTPLIHAARSGDLKLVKYLVSKGADAAATLQTGEGARLSVTSPLVEAGSAGYPDVMAYLLKTAGFPKDASRKTLYMQVPASGSLACLKMLMKAETATKEEQEMAMVGAAAYWKPGRMACTQYLLDQGVEVSSQALSVALMQGNYDALPQFVASGCKIQPESLNHVSFMWRVAQEGRADVVKYLVENGIREKEYKGSDEVLNAAVKGAASNMVPGHLEIIRYLASRGCRLSPDKLKEYTEKQVAFGEFYMNSELQALLKKLFK